MMILSLWARRRGEDSPELLVAWDEYSVEQNREGFDEECREALRGMGEDLIQERELHIHVPMADIDAAFDSPVLRGSLDES